MGKAVRRIGKSLNGSANGAPTPPEALPAAVASAEPAAGAGAKPAASVTPDMVQTFTLGAEDAAKIATIMKPVETHRETYGVTGNTNANSNNGNFLTGGWIVQAVGAGTVTLWNTSGNGAFGGVAPVMTLLSR